jgi:hypothetical protein
MVVVIARGTVLAAIAAGCGSPAARVSLEPVNGCGNVQGPNAITVTAFTQGQEVKRSLQPDEVVDIADFPEDTVQLGVEILVANGKIGVAGKTAPFAFADLADGAHIPIYMGALDGLCPTHGKMLNKRRAPRIVPAGDGVLIAGGIGETNKPLSTMEYYDRATSTFSPIAVPESLQDALNGLVGVALTPLPDGKVVITGGARFAVFDPATQTFGPTLLLVPQRVFHGAIALDATHVLLSGGCQGVSGEGCAGDPLTTTFEYDLNARGTERTPLTSDAVEEGAQLFDTGAEYVLAGGFANSGEAQVFTLDDTAATKIVGLAGQAALLDGGAVFTALGADGLPASHATAILAQGGGKVAQKDGPDVANARLATLEDGTVLVVGGDPGGLAGGIARYNPTRDTWLIDTPAGDPPGTLARPALARLSDGSVLVLGGEATPSDSAWIYRPALVGPASASVTATPTADNGSIVLTAPNPLTLTRMPMHWVLRANDDTLAARALVGGPRMRRGSVRASVEVQSGGLALIAQQVAPNRALVAHLVPGEKARLEQLGTGTLCTGSMVDTLVKVTATMTIGTEVQVTLQDASDTSPMPVVQTVLSCDVPAPDTGAWGIAATGTGSQIDVATVTVARTR